ncbi:hypothetical protein CEXT_127651 [Caerostris extrusa]|uniref:Uncharacterized protein n=1 Tax=Caerostris extrusa TaxID=172846 RepID=A0AAV4V1Q7_CAEEX|nr:hypothetical protein CEXT_127651 [Caerostris extrusa]
MLSVASFVRRNELLGDRANPDVEETISQKKVELGQSRDRKPGKPQWKKCKKRKIAKDRYSEKEIKVWMLSTDKDEDSGELCMLCDQYTNDILNIDG